MGNIVADTKRVLKNQIEKVLYYVPANYFFSTATLARYKFLMQSQWWPYDKLLALQTQKIQALVEFAFQYVPFYRNIARDLKIEARDIRTPMDLHVLPIINKQTVNSRYQDFLPEYKFAKVWPAATSGSTGEFLKLSWTEDFLAVKSAANLRYWTWAGRGWSDKNIRIGYPLVGLTGNSFYKRDYRMKTWKVNTAGLNDAKMAKIVEILNRLKPACISGYASAIGLVADFMDENKITLRQYPKSILTTGELIRDDTRDRIERFFRAKLYDWYGMVEGCTSAGQCEYGNYHLNLEYTLTELVDVNGFPKIVGTNLENFAFPLIRYDTGDIGEMSDRGCPCKRELPVMRPVAGRIRNLIKTPDGRRHLVPNNYLAKLSVSVKEIQIVQKVIDAIDVTIVRKNGFKEEDQAVIDNKLRQLLGHRLDIRYHYKEMIERGPRGKYQMIVSQVG